MVTAAFAQNGVIRELSGTVELKAPGSSAYVQAKSGDQVSEDTIISTGFKSSALVAIGNALLTVRPLTRLTLQEISSASGTETLNVNLQAGRVRVDVNPPSGTRAAMTVSSPVATASVRGTSFEFDTKNLWVNHGQVSFKGQRGPMMLVNAGSSSRIQEDGKVADPVSIKIAGLSPQMPVGSNPSGGSPSGEGSASAALSITVDYRDILGD